MRVVLLVLLSVLSCQAWTDKGHKMLPELALKLLPPEVPVLREYGATVVDMGPEPDRWRVGADVLKQAQEPDHYTNFEDLEWMKVWPPTRPKYNEAIYAEAARTGGKNPRMKPEVIGFQPYIVAEVFERLRVTFGEYAQEKLLRLPTRETEQRIAVYAGWLSHYVADGALPIHTSIHYDGWIGANPEGFNTKRGVHYKFEGRFVEENIRAEDVAALAPRIPTIQEPWADYMAYLRHSFSLIHRLYELEKAGGFDGRGTRAGRDFELERLAAGRDMVAAVWVAAWEQSQFKGCIPYQEAEQHIGQVGCVLGAVVSRKHQEDGATLLNLCKAAHCPLTVEISAQALYRFRSTDIRNGKYQFIGLVSGSAGRARIVIRDPAQIGPVQ